MKVKREIAERLVEAIENKEFTYHPNYLKTDKGYSIQGMLCELVKEELGLGWKKLGYETLDDGTDKEQTLLIYSMNNLQTITSGEVDDYIKSSDPIPEEDLTDSITLFYEDQYWAIEDLEDELSTVEEIVELIKEQWL